MAWASDVYKPPRCIFQIDRVRALYQNKSIVRIRLLIQFKSLIYCFQCVINQEKKLCKPYCCNLQQHIDETLWEFKRNRSVSWNVKQPGWIRPCLVLVHEEVHNNLKKYMNVVFQKETIAALPQKFLFEGWSQIIISEH